MIFGIASYHRPECRTIQTLYNAGVKKSDIVVSLQDEEDIPKYKANYPDITFIYSEADSAAGNRNTLLRNIQERPICLLDDDIVSFCSLTDDGRFIVNNEKAMAQIKYIFEHPQKNIIIAGCSPNANGIIVRHRPEISIDILLQGSVLIVYDKDFYFDENFKMVEDYEISLRAIYSGKHTARWNYVCANKPKNGTNEGGLHERYINNELPHWLKVLQKKYPIFRPNKTYTGGDIKWTR